MKNALTKNLGWKALSLAAAVEGSSAVPQSGFHRP